MFFLNRYEKFYTISVHMWLRYTTCRSCIYLRNLCSRHGYWVVQQEVPGTQNATSRNILYPSLQCSNVGTLVIDMIFFVF
jgi:hypothetical protein